MRALPLLITYEAKATVVRALARELGLNTDDTEQAVTLFEQGLPPLTSSRWLPFLLGVSPKFVGAMAARSEHYYRRFKLAKKSGGFREVVTPRRFLKTIQRWLLRHALPVLPRSEHVHGFVEGRGIFSNAEPHLAGKNLLVADIGDFFPSVSRQRVENLLSSHLPYPQPVIRQLCGLMTLDGALPQGAPTSPALANAAFHDADLHLGKLAQGWGCVYTRYADDLAFSGNRFFEPTDLLKIQEIVDASGFELRREKCRIVGSGGRQIVAGIVVNKAGLPPRVVRRRWRAMFHRASRYPHEFADRATKLAGVASFINQYSPALASQYFAVVEHVRRASAPS